MRLLHLIHTPRHSGAEMLVCDLCLAHGRQGIATGVVACAPADPGFQPEVMRLRQHGVSVDIPTTELSKSGRVTAYARAIRAFRPDVVFAHAVLPSLYGRLAAVAAPRRLEFVGVLHDASNDDFADPYLALVERLLRFRLDHVVAVSSQGAESYRRRFGMRAPISVVPNGIDLARFGSVDRLEARHSLGISLDRRLVLQVGRVSSIKQQAFTLKALAPLLREGGTELWFAGLTQEPDYRAAVERQISALELERCVTFLGTRSDVPDLLAAADLYVMPSLAESQGIALLEALASGAPVIISSIPAFDFARQLDGVATVETEDTAGFLDAARCLLGAGRFERRLEELSIGRTAERYAELARKLMTADGIAGITAR